MLYDKHFIPSPPKAEVSPTSSASSESSEDYIPGRDLVDTERYTRFQRELAQRIASYVAPPVAPPVAPAVAPAVTPAVTRPVATRVTLPMRISEQTREDDDGDDYEEEEDEELRMYPSYAERSVTVMYSNKVLTFHRLRRRGRRLYPRHTRRTSCNTP
jgi:hypothetical protein